MAHIAARLFMVAKVFSMSLQATELIFPFSRSLNLMFLGVGMEYNMSALDQSNDFCTILRI